MIEGSGGFFLLNTGMGSLQEILPETDRPAEDFPMNRSTQISDPDSLISRINNNEVILQVEDNSERERARQDEYLASYGLYRQPIIGDGNCLFRSVSLARYGNQDHHQELRNIAINEIEQNLGSFRNFFFHANGNSKSDSEIQQELNNFRQLGTFAGQESILALSRRLGINVLVTFGGDVDNQDIVTLEHDVSNSVSRIHLVWTRAWGGHYETVTEAIPNHQEILVPSTAKSGI